MLLTISTYTYPFLSLFVASSIDPFGLINWADYYDMYESWGEAIKIIYLNQPRPYLVDNWYK
jgi:hypothetical protein